MIREWGIEHIFFLLLLLNLGLFFLFVGIIQHPTGRIVAEGGASTEVNVTSPFSDVSWGMVYGNMSSSGSTNVTIGTGSLLQRNIPSFNPEQEHLIIASTKKDVNFSNLVPANASLIDTYLGVEASGPQSGSNTFTERANISLTYIMETVSVVTNSETGVYRTALFSDGGTPVFVTKTVDGVGFDMRPWDFQLFLPIRGSETYYLSARNNVTVITCDSFDINLSARLVNNHSEVLLHWNQIPGVTHYELESGRDPGSFSHLVNTSDMNHTLGLHNDTSLYRTKAIFDHLKCTSRIVGSTQIDLSYINNNGFNLVSVPFIPENTSFQSVLEPIYPALERSYWYDNENKIFEVFFLIDTGTDYIAIDNIKSFRPQDGYWINVKDNTTLPMAGALVNRTEKNLTMSFTLGGFHMMENNSVTEVFDQMYDELDRVYAYDNTNKLYYSPFIIINDGMGGYIPIVSFTEINPFDAYYIKITHNTTEVWT
ncbi:MAG: hypothetical protein ACQESG_03855 [Nanobdellota archaeon]